MTRFHVLLLLTSLPGASFLQAGAVVVTGPVNPFEQMVHVAPGQIETLYVTGLALKGGQSVNASSLPLPLSLGGISVTISVLSKAGTPVPLLSAMETSDCASSLYPDAPCASVLALTVQIPTEIQDSDPYGDGITSIDLIVVSDQAGDSGSLLVEVDANAIHVLTAQVPGFNARLPVLTRTDGTPLGFAEAHAGDVLVIYVYGLGKTSPLVPSGNAAPPGTLSPTVFPVAINFDFSPNAGLSRLPFSPSGYSLAGYPQPLFAGATPRYVGLYQVNFQVPPVPPGTPSCGGNIGSNLTVAIIGQVSLDGFALCVG